MWFFFPASSQCCCLFNFHFHSTGMNRVVVGVLSCFFFTFFLLLMLVLSCRREAPSTTLRCAQPTALCLTRLFCTLIFITKNSLPIERVWLIIAFNASVSRLTLFFFCSVYRHFQRVCIFIVGPFVWPCSIVFSVIRLRLTCFWLFNY